MRSSALFRHPHRTGRSVAAGVMAVVALMTTTPTPAFAATVKVACLQRGVSGLVAKPTRCAVVDPGRSASSGADLWNLTWTKWGKKSATGRGVDQVFRNDGTAYKVTVTVSRKKNGRYRTVVVDYGDGLQRTFAPR
jgi:hypothetical protein